MTSSAAASQNTLVPFAVLFLGVACIGLSPIFARLVDLGPLTLGFYRVFLCLPILLTLNLVLPKKPVKTSTNNRKMILGTLLAILFFSSDLFFWHAALDNTSVANASLLSNTVILFVAIGGWVLFGQRLNRIFVLGMFCAFIGIAMLGADSLQLQLGTIYGDALGIGAAISYSGYLLSINWMRGCFSTRQLMLLTNLGCSIVLLVLMLIFESALLPYSLYAFVVLLAMAWVSQLIGQGSIAYSLGYLPAAFSAIAMLLQPLIAASVAWFVFDEVLSRLQILGGVAVLVGLVVCKQSSKSLIASKVPQV